MSTPSPTANLIGITGIARRLVLDGALAEADARRAQEEATKEKKTVPVWLAEKRLVTAAQIAAANAMEFGVPLFDLTSLDLKQAPTKLVSEQTITTHQALPLFKRGNRLYVAIADPTNTRGLDEIKFQTNLSTEAILVDSEQLRRGIEQALMATDDFTAGGDDDDGDRPRVERGPGGSVRHVSSIPSRTPTRGRGRARRPGQDGSLDR